MPNILVLQRKIENEEVIDFVILKYMYLVFNTANLTLHAGQVHCVHDVGRGRRGLQGLSARDQRAHVRVMRKHLVTNQLAEQVDQVGKRLLVLLCSILVLHEHKKLSIQFFLIC